MNASGPLVRFVTTSARRSPVGESHGRCTHPDTLVERARALRQAGHGVNAIARQLGLDRSTVFDWVTLRRRRPHARVIVKRARPHTPISERGQLPMAAAHTASAPTPAATQDDDFSELA